MFAEIVLVCSNEQSKKQKKINFNKKEKKSLQKQLKKVGELCIMAMFTNYGEMAERSKAAVLKTVDVKASWGSNP